MSLEILYYIILNIPINLL